MRRIIPLIALTMTLSACVEEPSPKASEKAVEAIEQAEQQDTVRERQRTIEEAAEEATKLIEADAKSEADELSRGDPTE
jgi:PBP1b-binding outer membrane lipoprotein LpoB